MKITQSVKLINDPSFAFEACFSCDKLHMYILLMKGKKECSNVFAGLLSEREKKNR